MTTDKSFFRARNSWGKCTPVRRSGNLYIGVYVYIYMYKYIYIYPSDRLETSRWYPGTPVSIFFRPNTRYICVGFHYFQERWQGEIVHGLFQCFQITVPGIQRCSFYSVTNVSPWQAVAQAVTASNMLPLWNRIHTWYTPERLMLCRKLLTWAKKLREQ